MQRNVSRKDSSPKVDFHLQFCPWLWLLEQNRLRKLWALYQFILALHLSTTLSRKICSYLFLRPYSFLLLTWRICLVPLLYSSRKFNWISCYQPLWIGWWLLILFFQPRSFLCTGFINLPTEHLPVSTSNLATQTKLIFPTKLYHFLCSHFLQITLLSTLAPKTETWETILAPPTPWHHISGITMYILLVLPPSNSWSCACSGSLPMPQLRSLSPFFNYCNGTLSGFSSLKTTSFK